MSCQPAASDSNPRTPSAAAGSGLGLALAVSSLVAAPADGQISIRVNNVIRVAATDASSTNCARLQEVLASITDSSVANRYLVELEPGIYHCGESVVALEEGVTVQGLGLVEIWSNFGSANVGTVHLFSHSSLRDVKVVNTQTQVKSGSIAVSVFDLGAAVVDVELYRVQFLSTGDPPNNYALHAVAAEVDVYHSRVLGGLVLIDGGAHVTFHYSRTSDVLVTSTGATATCHLSANGASVPLGTDCRP